MPRAGGQRSDLVTVVVVLFVLCGFFLAQYVQAQRERSRAMRPVPVVQPSLPIARTILDMPPARRRRPDPFNVRIDR